MKTFVKILLGFVIAFFGISVFRYFEGQGFNKAVAEQGDAAVLANDFEFFQNRFEYYKEEPLVQEHVEVDEDVSFDLYVYHQANIKQAEGNYLTFLVHGLTIENQAPYLKLLFDFKINKQEEDKFISLVKVGDENWYLQWIRLSLDEIKSFNIHHNDLLLYEYEDEKPFLSAQDFDLTHFIKNENLATGIIDGMSSEPSILEPASQGNELAEEITYNVDFQFLLSGFKTEEDFFISGYFNDWDETNDQYKLKKDKNGLYSTNFEIKSKYEKLVFKITTGNGEIVVDKDNNVRYFTYDFIDAENSQMEDYNIYKSNEPSFNSYNYYKWVAILIYVGIIAGIGALIFFLNKPKQTPIRPVYNQTVTKEDEDIIIDNDVANKQIEEPKSKDEL